MEKIVSDVILNKSNHETTTLQNSPPATRPPERSPSESSISSCRSSLSHEDGSEHSLHPSPPPAIVYHPPDESVTSVYRSVRNEPVPSKKAYAAAAVEHGFLGGAAEEGGGRGGVSTNATRRPKTTSSTTMSRRRSEGAVKKAALGFRVFGFVFCLISFSVMAADRRKGWAAPNSEFISLSSLQHSAPEPQTQMARSRTRKSQVSTRSLISHLSSDSSHLDLLSLIRSSLRSRNLFLP